MPDLELWPRSVACSNGSRPCRSETRGSRAGRGRTSPTPSASAGRPCTRSTQAGGGSAERAADVRAIHPWSSTRGELAQIEARALGHGCIGTEHLVLALVTEDMGVSTAVLNDCGITEEGMKRLLMNFWSTDDLRTKMPRRCG